MGGPVVTPIVEEGTAKALQQWAEGWFSSSGERFLSHMGEGGKFLTGVLKQFETKRDIYRSNLGNNIRKVFEDFPDIQDRKHVEDIALGKTTTPKSTQHLAAGKKLEQINKSMTTMANNSGIVGHDGQPLKMGPNGPNFYSDEVQKANSPTRLSAIREVLNNVSHRFTTGLTSVEAGGLVNSVASGQRSREGIKYIYDNPYNFTSGRIEDPSLRWQKWAETIGTKLAEIEHFGHGDINLGAIVDGIAKQQGRVSGNNVADFLDIFLHQTVPTAYRKFPEITKKTAYEVLHDFEKSTKKLGGFIFTSRIAVPHASQFINIPLASGSASKTLQSIMESLTDYTKVRNWVLNTGALEEALHGELETGLRGGQTWAEKVLRQPGFHVLRNFQTVIAANTGRLVAEEMGARLVANAADKEAITSLYQLGLDGTAIAKRGGKLTDMEIKQAAYNVANKSMFFKSTLGTPFRWEQSPMARTASMYRHFSFREFKLIKNAFTEAYAREGMAGVTKTAAYVGTVFPVAGSLIAAAENILTGNPVGNKDIEITGNDKVDWYINALAHASAFGMTYSLVRAAKRRMLLNWAVGPVPSSISEFTYDTIETGRKGDATQLGRDALRKVPLIGPLAAEKMLPREVEGGRNRIRTRSRSRGKK